MKKLLSLMLVGAIPLTGLIACGNETDEEQETPPTGEDTEGEVEETTIKIWLDDDAWAEAMIPAIEEALPHITIEYENVGAVDARSKLELDGPAGLAADIFIQPHDGMSPAIASNILLPLGDELEAMVNERFLEGSVATVTSGDSMYGVPLLTESIALFYNKTLLEEAGLSVATSMEQLIEDAKGYNDPASNKFLFRFDVDDSYVSHFFLTASGFQLYGPDHLDASAVNFDTPEFVAGLEAFYAMKEILPVPAADLTWDATLVEFSLGNVPYTISGPWAIAAVSEGAEDLGFEYGITTIPTINGVQPKTFSGNIIACISAYTAKADAAREVVEFLSSDEGLQVTYDVTGKIPALIDNSVIEGVLQDPYVSGILAQAAHSEPMPIIPEMANYWTPAATAYASVWDELATPEEAAQKAMDDYNALDALSE